LRLRCRAGRMHAMNSRHPRPQCASGLFSLPFAIALLPMLVGGCVQSTSISLDDAERVLTLTATAANKKLDAGYCIRPELENSTANWAGQVGKGGWITAPNDANIRYHPLAAPEIRSLPRAALMAFTKAKVDVDCRHSIVFDKPQFIQFKSKNEQHVEAYVNFSDRCPLCGFGSVARFRKVGDHWELTPEGIEGTWIS